MFYSGLIKNDVANGPGLRVTVFLSGCEHYCEGCQNPATWYYDFGQPFNLETRAIIYRELKRPEIAGLTISGGDPLVPMNRKGTKALVEEIKREFPNKTIWVYTGYNIEDIDVYWLAGIDVLVDGKFIKDKASLDYPWAGSTNQRVIDVAASIQKGRVILYDS